MGSVEVSRLARFYLFDGLSQQEMGFVAANCTEKMVPAGSVLIQQGQVGKEIYFLEEGSVKVYRGKADSSKALAVIQAPAVLGEMALSDPERIQTSSASALSDLKLLSIPMETLLVLTGVYPSVKKKLREAIASGHGS